MFETGKGNLDAARALRSAGNATAGSVFATIYRTLPNDTDFSETAALGLPGLNFAFADGVERYHTSRDDVAHLNPGSLQHHGSQMLAMARTFGTEPLPRPHTGDGVFFDLPIVGLIVYPQGVWYHKVQEQDAAEIVASHLANGRVVSRLVWIDLAAMKSQAIDHRNKYRESLKNRAQSQPCTAKV